MPNIKYHKSNSKSGFSLIEVMVATFIFALIMVAVAMTFSSLFGGYKGAKTIQKNLENAQYAMNLMAKSLRTSSLVGIDMGIDQKASEIKFYNYSEGKCMFYELEDKIINVAFLPAPDEEPDKRTWCSAVGPYELLPLTAANINKLSINNTKSKEGVVGKVTI